MRSGWQSRLGSKVASFKKQFSISILTEVQPRSPEFSFSTHISLLHCELRSGLPYALDGNKPVLWDSNVHSLLHVLLFYFPIAVI